MFSCTDSYCHQISQIKVGIFKKNKNKIMKVLHWIAMVILIIGGLNWGLVGFFGFDLVATIFGDMSSASKVVYDIVGIAALVVLLTLPGMCKKKTMM